MDWKEIAIVRTLHTPQKAHRLLARPECGLWRSTEDNTEPSVVRTKSWATGDLRDLLVISYTVPHRVCLRHVHCKAHGGPQVHHMACE